MKQWSRISLAVGALALAAITGIAALGWTLQVRFKVGALRESRLDTRVTGEPYHAAASTVTPVTTPTWLARERREGWRCDLFTPPLLAFDATAGGVVLTETDRPTDEAMPWGVELVEVRREVFPWQLVGYLGSPGNLVAILASANSAETLLARAGERLAAYGYEVVRVERRVLPPAHGGSSLGEETVVAVLRDVATRIEVELDHRQRKYTGALSALVRLEAERAPREVRVGDVLELAAGRVRVARVAHEPAEIEVVLTNDTQPWSESRVLRPVAVAVPPAR
jgi:hypothetical protein